MYPEIQGTEPLSDLEKQTSRETKKIASTVFEDLMQSSNRQHHLPVEYFGIFDSKTGIMVNWFRDKSRLPDARSAYPSSDFKILHFTLSGEIMPESCIACGKFHGGVQERLNCYEKKLKELFAFKNRLDGIIESIKSIPMTNGGSVEDRTKGKGV